MGLVKGLLLLVVASVPVPTDQKSLRGGKEPCDHLCKEINVFGNYNLHSKNPFAVSPHGFLSSLGHARSSEEFNECIQKASDCAGQAESLKFFERCERPGAKCFIYSSGGDWD